MNDIYILWNLSCPSSWLTHIAFGSFCTLFGVSTIRRKIKDRWRDVFLTVSVHNVVLEEIVVFLGSPWSVFAVDSFPPVSVSLFNPPVVEILTSQGIRSHEFSCLEPIPSHHSESMSRVTAITALPDEMEYNPSFSLPNELTARSCSILT